jgi:hypothetical protein
MVELGSGAASAHAGAGGDGAARKGEGRRRASPTGTLVSGHGGLARDHGMGRHRAEPAQRQQSWVTAPRLSGE